jgi:hypothetical protein
MSLRTNNNWSPAGSLGALVIVLLHSVEFEKHNSPTAGIERGCAFLEMWDKNSALVTLCEASLLRSAAACSLTCVGATCVEEFNCIDALPMRTC